MREAGAFIPLFPVVLANCVPQGTASFRGQPPSHRFLCLWFFLSLFPVTPPSPHVLGLGRGGGGWFQNLQMYQSPGTALSLDSLRTFQNMCEQSFYGAPLQPPCWHVPSAPYWGLSEPHPPFCLDTPQNSLGRATLCKGCSIFMAPKHPPTHL